MQQLNFKDHQLIAPHTNVHMYVHADTCVYVSTFSDLFHY